MHDVALFVIAVYDSQCASAATQPDASYSRPLPQENKSTRRTARAYPQAIEGRVDASNIHLLVGGTFTYDLQARIVAIAECR